MDDDVLAKRLGVGHRQAVNPAAGRLQAQGRLRRYTGPDGKIVNALPASRAQQTSEPTPLRAVPGGGDHGRITEDEVKEAVRAHLAPGASMSQSRGAASAGSTSTLGTPTAAATSSRPRPRSARMGLQQVNYFVGMLGELVQHMDDAQASYGIALPDNRQYRGLVNRLPALATERLRLAVFWVSREGDQLTVEVDS